MAVATAPADAAREQPAEWDRRVERFVSFVERERGLEFAHPIRVRFLGDAAFRKATADWYGDLTEKDRELADLESSDLLALGLIGAPVDLLAAEQASDATDVLGFYDDETEEIVVRGTDVGDVERRLTIVHELVHALQDQHYDLGKLGDHTDTGGEQFALDAVVEGDATLVENEYLWSLPQRTQDAYWDELDRDATEADGTTDPAVPEYPVVLGLFDSVDYDLAPTALDVAVAARGRAEIDRLFRSPPRSEEAIVDPLALERRDQPSRVSLPTFGDGETPKGPADDWGAYSWYLTLASRIPWPQALTAVEGWGGDRYRSFTRGSPSGEQPCVRIAVTGDTPRDTKELQRAIEDWAAAMPEGAAQVTRTGDLVVLSACWTGVAPPSPDDALDAAYDRLWERTDQMWYLADADLPLVYGRCVADAIVADAVAQPLLYPDGELTNAEDRTLDRRFDAAADRCV